MQPQNTMPDHGVDREGAMAKADLFKLANYSLKLFKQLQDEDQLESWVQAKITKAADYIASVYHYLEYEMKFNDYGHQLDNAELVNEDQKTELKNKLLEAKDKISKLKKAQAEKIKEAAVIGGGKEEPCPHCGGAGHVVSPGKVVPQHVQDKVQKYKTLVKATKAAHKRMDANSNGIPDQDEDKEVDEEFNDKSKVGDTFKTKTGVATKTSTGVMHKNTSYHDDGEAEQKSGKGIKTHAKSQSAAEKKEKAPAQKMSPKSAKTWGMKDSEKFDNRDKEVDETYGQGVYQEGMEPKDKPKKGEKMGREGNAFGKAVRDAKKDGIQPGEKVKVGGKEYPVKEGKSAYGSYDTDKVTGTVKIDKPGITVEALAKMKETTVQDIMSNNPGIDPRQPIPVGTVIGLNSGSSTGGYSKSNPAMPQGQMRESLKGKQKNLDVDDDGDIEADDLADLRAGKKAKEKKVDEAKPSAGMSKGAKSSLVKKAKAGGDIGKPGKSFDKVAKAAGGGEKGEKIAAAAMWKNAHESVETTAPVLAESAEMARMKQLTKHLLG